MDFRLRDDTAKWFNKIDSSSPLKTKFDLYYFCLIFGFASGRKTDPTANGRKAPEFIPYFVEDFKPAQKTLIGLLIISELKAHGIDVTEKDDVRKVIQGLVDPNTVTNLSDEGMRLMNMYVSGGYDHLAEIKEEKPLKSDTFMIEFTVLLDELISGSPNWT
jgi:hypothetical protein